MNNWARECIEQLPTYLLFFPWLILLKLNFMPCQRHFCAVCNALCKNCLILLSWLLTKIEHKPPANWQCPWKNLTPAQAESGKMIFLHGHLYNILLDISHLHYQWFRPLFSVPCRGSRVILEISLQWEVTQTVDKACGFTTGLWILTEKEVADAQTLIFLLECSEPITEEGDGETEHLPSEDGKEGIKYEICKSPTVKRSPWVCLCMCVQSGRQWQCSTMWRDLRQSCPSSWAISSSSTAKPPVIGGEVKREELRVSFLTSTSVCWMGEWQLCLWSAEVNIAAKFDCQDHLLQWQGDSIECWHPFIHDSNKKCFNNSGQVNLNQKLDWKKFEVGKQVYAFILCVLERQLRLR